MTLIGDEYYGKVAKLYPWLHSFGLVSDKLELKKLYRDHSCLIVPSLTETFGMVYIEALSQGLKIIHSRNQGVDQFFTKNVNAFSVNPLSVKSIEDCIFSVSKSNITKIQEDLELFSDSNVGGALIKLYQKKV